ncbi:MAG: gliding motility-associated C-terminal domain-containing protein, partial [Bacteroidia bacterium]|nr:gliding motility-associated C-terminal domain-containing protein [Bacteroidia bacterium]
MKKFYYSLLLIMLSTFSTYSQTVIQVIDFSGAQANGCCTVCGNDYWCLDNYLGCGSAGCGTKVFFDPVPSGYVITSILIKYYTAGCYGDALFGTINGAVFPTVNETNTGCSCSNNPCGISAVTSNTYPCGIPSYNYGSNNTLQICPSAANSICMDRVELEISYVLPAQITPVITPNGPLTFCQGGSVTLDAGAGYPAYSWSNGATSQTINVSTSGTYTATVTSTTGCTTGNASATVTVNPVPAPITTAVGPNSTICSGEIVTITTAPTAGVTTNVFSTPTGGASLGTLNFTSPPLTTNTTYYLETQNASGCVASTTRDIVTITVNPKPTPLVTASTATICNGGTGTYSTTSTGTLNWTVTGGTITSGQGTSSINVTWGNVSPSKVVLEETNSFGCKNKDSVSINLISTSFTPSLTSTNLVSCTGATGTYTTSNTNSGTVIWYAVGGNIAGGQGTNMANVTWGNVTSGYVIVEETSTLGCKNRDSVMVTINTTPTAFSTSGLVDTICAGNSIIMGSATPNVTTSVYTLPIGGTAVGTVNYTTPVLNNTTTYYFETISDSGCIAKAKRDSIIIVVNPLPAVPVISTLFNNSICIGLRDTLKTTTVAGVVTNVYATITGGALLGTLNFVTPPIVANVTYYFETKIVSTNCFSKTVRDSITIVVLPRPAKATLSLTPNDSLCENDTIVLKSITTIGNTVKWYSTNNGNTSIGIDSAVIVSKATQYYYAEVKNTIGCKASEVRDSLLVTILPLPNPPNLLTYVKPICEGDSIVLRASVVPSTATIYWLSSASWQDTITTGTSFTSPILTSNTTYYLATNTVEGCQSKAANFLQIPVIVKPLPHITITSNSQNNTVYEGESIIFESNPNTYDVYTWYIDSKQVYQGGYLFETQNPSGTQNIKVQVTGNGCINWADNSLTIKTLPLSNAFSPNGDGKNDLFLKGLDLTIFNRWGQILFTGNQGWDGKYNGSD